MTKKTIIGTSVVTMALGLAVVPAVWLLAHGNQSLGSMLPPSAESIAKASSALSLSPGPHTAMYHQRGPLSSGPGSYCGTLSLTYICRRLAIGASPAEIARLLNDRGSGVSMLDLARAAKLLGLDAKGVRTNLAGLKALPKPVIAFLPELKHFVVVSKADEKGIMCIDLTGPTALACYTPEEFACEWNGEVLVFSDDGPDLYTPLSEGEMTECIGGGCSGGPCNTLVQQGYEQGGCDECQPPLCYRYDYTVYFTIYECSTTDPNISCLNTDRPTHAIYPCEEDGPTECTKGPPTMYGSVKGCYSSG